MASVLATISEMLIMGSASLKVTIISEKAQENPFLNQMAHYAQFCKEETLQRMLKVCSALADEDNE